MGEQAVLSIQRVGIIAGHTQVAEDKIGQALAAVAKEQQLQQLHLLPPGDRDDAAVINRGRQLQVLLILQRQFRYCLQQSGLVAGQGSLEQGPGGSRQFRPGKQPGQLFQGQAPGRLRQAAGEQLVNAL